MNTFRMLFHKKPVTFSMIYLACFILGFLSISKIQIGFPKNRQSNVLTIETEYKGISPDKIEEIITKPIEDSLGGIGGIREIFSISEEGKSILHLYLNGTDEITFKLIEILERLDRVSVHFPRDSEKPVVLRSDPDKKPFFILSAKSETIRINTLRDFLEAGIKKQIESIPSVSEVSISGGSEKEISVSCDKSLLEKYGISISEITHKLNTNNFNTLVGEIQILNQMVKIRSIGKFENLSSISRIIVKSKKGLVRLQDIAKIEYSTRVADSASRTNGEESVSIYVQISEQGDALEISKKIQKIILQITSNEIQFEIKQDYAELLKKSFQDIITVSLSALTVISIFILIANNIYGLFFCLLQPLASIFMAFFLMFISQTRLTSDILTVMYIHSGILILLNFLEFNFPDKNKKNIALQYSLIFIPVTIPFIFMNDFSEIRNSAMVVYYLLYFVYMLLKLFCPVQNPSVKKERFTLSYSYFLEIVSRQIEKGVNLHKFIFLRNTKLQIFAFIAISTIGSAFLFYSIKSPESNNTNDSENLEGKLEFSSGTNFSEMNRISKIAENSISTISAIKEIHTRIRGESTQLFLKLHDTADDLENIKQEIEKKTEILHPAFIHFLGNGSDYSETEIVLDFYGEDLNKLDKFIKTFTKNAEKIQGIRKIFFRYKPPRNDFRIHVDRSKSGRSALNSKFIGEEIKLSVLGGVATKFIENGREIDVKVRADERYRKSPEDLGSTKLLTHSEKFVPVNEISELDYGSAPSKIYRKNKRRNLSASFLVSPNAYKEVNKELLKLKNRLSTENIRVDFSETENSLHSESTFSLALKFFLSGILLFIALFTYFESPDRTAKILFFCTVILSLNMSICYFLKKFAPMQNVTTLFLLLSISRISGLTFEESFLSKTIPSMNSLSLFYRKNYSIETLNTTALLSMYFMPAVFYYPSGLVNAHTDALLIITGFFIYLICSPLMGAVTIVLYKTAFAKFSKFSEGR